MDNDAKQKHLIELISSGRKIEAIKFLREEDNCGLAEAKQQVEILQRKLAKTGRMDPVAAKSGCASILLIAGTLLGALLILLVIGPGY